MHSTYPYAYLRHQEWKSGSFLLLFQYVVSQELILFLSNFDVKIGIFKFIDELIPNNVWLWWKNLAFLFGLFPEKFKESKVHTKISGRTCIDRNVLNWILWNWGLSHDCRNFNIFEEFLEETNEERVDLGMVRINDFEYLEERVLNVSYIFHY